jgi:hypothetical protein
MDLRVEHHWTCDAAPPAGAHWPLSHWQALISAKPQTLIIPLAAQAACTAAGSVGLSLLTQAGMAPQQLPTFFTAQSALVLQAVLTTTSWRTSRGGSGEDIGGGALGGAGGGGGVLPARLPAAGSVAEGAAQAASENARAISKKSRVILCIAEFLGLD